MPATARSPGRHEHSLDFAGGPLVFDVWEPERPSDQLPVLLVHGWGASSSYWRLTAEALSQTTRVIVPDLPGTGRSQPVATPQGMHEQTASLSRILDALGIERVQIVGHSMGGAMGILVADAERERVDRLVLTSLCLFTSDAQRKFFKVVALAFRLSLGLRKTPLARAPFFAERMAARYFHRLPPERELIDRLYQDFLELDAASANACAAGATDPLIDVAAARLQAPTLLIACRQDDLMPVANVQFTGNLIPQCAVHWMDGSGHLPMLERPEEYVRVLRAFLTPETDPNQRTPTSVNLFSPSI
ncbi:alpha/beta fold hydrolase [Thiococcus pfennigii]|uniref:alpha/beta fold hydrolase n=2 Tax=Thiococcus pfennigii TaxID=1057 RepID=UPI0019033A18|nr:alpha/beta hydrolase [Thiococcus pfennigii]MBK1732610.1 hypothetical protein [Thiococcus pfennigii]